MVPDLIVYNYPSTEHVRHAGRNASTASAIFEVKTLSPGPSRYKNVRQLAVESRATAVVSEYVRKAKAIDRTFAPDVVGDGSSGVAGPFEQALSTFCNGRVIPIVAGAFGEVNKEFDDVLKLCARFAVARGDAVYNSPVFDTDEKGNAEAVTLRVYRRSVAATCARGRSLHKRSRLHFVRGSAAEAANVAREAKEHFTSSGRPGGYGFSARHAPREYAFYEQFCSSRDGQSYWMG